jgi:hypothetical protein
MGVRLESYTVGETGFPLENEKCERGITILAALWGAENMKKH